MTHWVIHTLHWALADWLALGLLFRDWPLLCPYPPPGSGTIQSRCRVRSPTGGGSSPMICPNCSCSPITIGSPLRAGQPAHQQIELSPETGRALRALCRKEGDHALCRARRDVRRSPPSLYRTRRHRHRHVSQRIRPHPGEPSSAHRRRRCRCESISLGQSDFHDTLQRVTPGVSDGGTPIEMFRRSN